MGSETEVLPPPNTPEAFESLCLDIWKVILGDPGTQKNGRSGQPQAGVDVYGQKDGKWVGIQCKQKDGILRSKLKVNEIDTEVKKALKFKPQLAAFILASSGPADVKVQERARVLTENHRRVGLDQ